MKQIILIVLIAVFSSSSLYSQKIEDFGAGVIDFLLRNPKTANKMKAEEAIALDIIGDLLKTTSERKHQLEYASAGKNQITINTTDSRQAEFVKNEQGQVFLLMDGVVYPIAQELVYEAQGINQNQQTKIINSVNNYESSSLKNTYQKQMENKNEVLSMFSYKWHKDFDRNGLSFNEFHQVQNEFYNNENFKIVAKLSTLDASFNLCLEFYNEYTGEKVESRCAWVNPTKNPTLEFFSICSNELPVGVYLVNLKLMDTHGQNKQFSFIQDKIKIVQGNSESAEQNCREKMIKDMVNNTTPQGIFFYDTWNDKNSNNQYDSLEFVRLNDISYSVKDVFHVGFNFPSKYGPIIIQSWTENRELLGTTVDGYQSIYRHAFTAYPSDFIDSIKKYGVGEYIISVKFIDGETFEQKLLIRD